LTKKYTLSEIRDETTNTDTDEHRNSVEYLTDIREIVINFRQALRKSLTFEAPKLNIPTFNLKDVLPKQLLDFKLPNITIPNIDTNTLEKLIEKSTSHGWTITNETPVADYLHAQDLEDELEVFDQYFLNLYTENRNKLYNNEKEFILNNINNENELIITQCFASYERGEYHIAIPSLLMLIEGQIYQLSKSNTVGFELLKKWRRIASNSDRDNLNLIMEISLIKFMMKSTFEFRDFEKQRRPIINRHRVLHGRDNPMAWKKSDALKLIINLSSILSVKISYEKITK